MGRALLIVAALLAASAGDAHAAGTVTYPGDGQPVVVADSPGTEQFLSLPTQGDLPSGFLFRFEPDALQAGAGCRQVRTTEIACDQPEGTLVDIRLDDGPDYLDAQHYAWKLVINGGSGDDSLFSGRARDRIAGGDGNDT